MKTEPLFIKSAGWPFFVGFLLLCMGGAMLAKNTSASLSYDDLERYIREKNGSIQSSSYSIDAAKAKTDSFRRSFSPHVSASLGSEGFYTAGRNVTRFQPVGSLDIAMNLSRGGQDQYEEDIRQAQVGLAEVQRHKTYTTELLNAQNLYWEIMYSDEMMRNTKDLLKQNAKSYASAKRRLQRGLLTQSDILAFELYKNRLEVTLESLEHEKKILMIKLKPILGVSEETPLLLIPAALPHEHDEMLLKNGVAVDKTLEIQELQLNETILMSQENKVRGKTKPSVDLFGAYTFYTESEREFSTVTDRSEVAAGIRAQFLIFDGKQTQSELNAAQLKLKSLSKLLEYKKQHLASEIKSVQEEMIHIQELLDRSVARLSQTKEFLGYLMVDYDRGIKDSTDMLTGIQMYQEVQETAAMQRRDYQKARAKLIVLLASNPKEN